MIETTDEYYKRVPKDMQDNLRYRSKALLLAKQDKKHAEEFG